MTGVVLQSRSVNPWRRHLIIKELGLAHLILLNSDWTTQKPCVWHRRRKRLSHKTISPSTYKVSFLSVPLLHYLIYPSFLFLSRSPARCSNLLFLSLFLQPPITSAPLPSTPTTPRRRRSSRTRLPPTQSPRSLRTAARCPPCPTFPPSPSLSKLTTVCHMCVHLQW